MSRIKEILSKVFGNKESKFSSNNPPLTPNEVELKAYKRREYLDNIKKELYQYRKKNNIFAEKDWNKEFEGKQKPFLNQKLLFKHKEHKEKLLLNNHNSLWK